MNNFIVDRVAEEREYVLDVLQRMRYIVIAKPDLFEPDAQRRIDEAIALLQGATCDSNAA
jgi:hypothetical protein